MNAIVFATYDVTPEHWADFGKTAAIPLSRNEHHNTPPKIPYVLVSSRSEQDYNSATNKIPSTVKTELGSAPDFELKALFAKLSEPNRSLHSEYFLVLDEQSEKDRKVVVMQEWLEWVDPEGNVDEGGPTGRDDLTERVLWKRHRVPFEKTFDFCAIVDLKPGLEGDEYLEEMQK